MAIMRVIVYMGSLNGSKRGFAISSESSFEDFKRKVAACMDIDLNRFDIHIKVASQLPNGSTELVDVVNSIGYEFMQCEIDPKIVVVDKIDRGGGCGFVTDHGIGVGVGVGVGVGAYDVGGDYHNDVDVGIGGDCSVDGGDYHIDVDVGISGDCSVDWGNYIEQDLAGPSTHRHNDEPGTSAHDVSDDEDNFMRYPSPIRDNEGRQSASYRQFIPDPSTQFSNMNWDEDDQAMQLICQNEMVPPAGSIAMHAIFTSKDDLVNALGQYSLENRFSHIVTRSDRGRFEAHCRNGKDCTFMIRAKCRAGCQIWVIHKFVPSHTCLQTIQQSQNRGVSAATIGRLYANKVIGANHQPSNVIQDMQETYGVKLGYTKAWRALQHAKDIAYGTPEDSYRQLPSYFYMLERVMPGTVTSVHFVDDHLLRSFCALGPSIEGFKYMRPVIVIDATHLKGVYDGKIYAAVCADGNEQIFPLAFGFGEEEGNEVWEWFLRKLQVSFGVPDDLVIVSDRHRGILHAMRVVYPDVPHVFCYRHLKENIRKYCRDPQVPIIFKNAVYTYDKDKCDQYMSDIQRIHSRVHRWLETDVGRQNWSRAYCPKNRYNHMTSNFVESFNEAIKKARKLPITSAHEFFRSLCQRWFNQRRELAAAMPNNITQYAIAKIEEEAAKIDQARLHTVAIREREEYVVCHPQNGNFIVDMIGKSCRCRRWDLDGLPCIHAIVVARQVGAHYYTLCRGNFFDTEILRRAYAPSIQPVPVCSTWHAFGAMDNVVVNPPIGRRDVGRPQDARYRSHSEQRRRKKTCKICGRRGHNRKTCPNAPTNAGPPDVNELESNASAPGLNAPSTAGPPDVNRPVSNNNSQDDPISTQQSRVSGSNINGFVDVNINIIGIETLLDSHDNVNAFEGNVDVDFVS